jgi:hypothetical protein
MENRLLGKASRVVSIMVEIPVEMAQPPARHMQPDDRIGQLTAPSTLVEASNIQ